MSWWPFGSGGDTSAAKKDATSSLPKSEYDELVPPPPSGGAVPPPSPPPKSVGSSAASATEPFKGFSPPPPAAPATTPSSSSLSRSSSAPSSASGSFLSLPSLGVGKGEDYYANEDFSKYTSPYSPESPGFYDRQYAEEERQRVDRLQGGREASLLDRYVTNPRLRGCLEGVKMGVKMGAAVGGIFGLLTGGYAAFAHRNFLILPVSMVGGAVSFGFFLGCGMIIRCEDAQAFYSPPSSSPFCPSLRFTKNITHSVYLSTAGKRTVPSCVALAGDQRRCVALPAYSRHW
ncbi:reactive oxygen species modulator 1 [Cystoisospora suis]|uniref:Reactive oxygen species modulator 1 n=1 Tax=Cystoisospora suis TaxID=483139 RepID=A0A2C6LDQ9_9APIC|nr:reactive oxygen species modulator 1 [Cystoisospora suis]